MRFFSDFRRCRLSHAALPVLLHPFVWVPLVVQRLRLSHTEHLLMRSMIRGNFNKGFNFSFFFQCKKLNLKFGPFFDSELEGTITGSILRCLDSSSDVDSCLKGLRGLLLEYCLVGVFPRIFRICLSRAARKYDIVHVLISAFRNM